MKGGTMDNAERRTMDNTSADSDINRSMLMYNRCSKLENWKDFQTKRYSKQHHSGHNANQNLSFMSSQEHQRVHSTLPVLKFHKERVFKPRGSFQGKKSRDNISNL
jgi:hypothetical protein